MAHVKQTDMFQMIEASFTVGTHETLAFVCARIHGYMYLFIHVPHKAVVGFWLASKKTILFSLIGDTT